MSDIVLDTVGQQRVGAITYDEDGNVIPAVYAFSAPLTHSLTQGSNQESICARTGTTAAITDYLGQVHPSLVANEPRFYGARRVQNLLQESNPNGSLSILTQPLVNSPVYNVEDPWGGNTALRLTINSTSAIFYQISDAVTDGREVVCSFYMRLLSASGAGTISFTNGNAVGANKEIFDVTAGEHLPYLNQWIRVGGDDGNASMVTFGIYFSIFGTGTCTFQLEIAGLMAEDVQGRAISIPQEFVPRRVGNRAELATAAWANSDADWTNWGLTKLAFTGGKWKYSNLDTTSESNYLEGAHYAWNAFPDGMMLISKIVINITVANVTAGNISFEVYHGYASADDKVYIQDLDVGRHELYFASRVNTTGGAGSGFYWIALNASLLSTDTIEFTIEEFSLKQLDLGTNVDGVQYFNTVPATQVDANYVITEKAPVAGAGEEFLDDPEFLVDATSSTSDWTWSGTDYVISGGVLSATGSFKSLTGPSQVLEPERFYRLEYKINSGSFITFAVAGLAIFNTTPGTYDYTFKAFSNTPTTLFCGVAGVSLEYFRLTPLDKLPPETMGILPERTITNYALQASNFSSATWVKTNVTVLSTAVVCPDGVTRVTVTLRADAANGTVLQTSGTTTRTVSCWIRRVSGVGSIYLVRDGNTLDISSQLVGGSWVKVSFTTVAGSVGSFGIQIGTNNEQVQVYGFQAENSATAGHYVPNDTGTGAASKPYEYLGYAVPALFAEATYNDYTLAFKFRSLQGYGFEDEAGDCYAWTIHKGANPDKGRFVASTAVYTAQLATTTITCPTASTYQMYNGAALRKTSGNDPDTQFSINGNTPEGTGFDGAVPGNAFNFFIGCNYTGVTWGNQFQRPIREFKVWKKALLDARLQGASDENS